MKITSWYRITRLGFINFWRNRWLSLAATLMMTLTLLIISFFAVLNLGINNLSEAIQNRLDVRVFFYDDKVPDSKIFALKDTLLQRSEVNEVKYTSKSQAIKEWYTFDLDPAVISQITPENNPLPRSLSIKTNEPEQIQAVADYLSGPQFSDIIHKGPKYMNWNQESNRRTTERLTRATRFTQKVGIIIGVIFIFVSILIILNTIRMTIFTRRDEIEIMKLVGANHAFIRYPFVIETMFYGVFATILSLLIISIGIKFTSPYVSSYFQQINLDMQKYFQENFLVICALQLVISLFVAIVCGLLTIRNYLRT